MDEREFIDSYEREEWQSVINAKETLQKYQTYALSSLEEAGVVSIALPQEDLGILRQRAEEAGLSYKNLIASILHQYITGHLVEKPTGV